MARVITIKNISGVDQTYSGQTILDTETYTLQRNEYENFQKVSALFRDVASGVVLVGDGTSDFTNPVKGWEWLKNDVSSVTITQTSELGKIAVHSSPKPAPGGIQTYAVWAGSGDLLVGGSPEGPLPEDQTLGMGELLQFTMIPNVPTVSRDVVFDPRHGRVWIHEAYLKFQGAGFGDSINADVIAPATPLQTVANKDYTIATGGWLVYAGPGLGTHGLAGNPVLVPRTYTKDGDWDYDGVNLTPNFGSGSPNLGPTGEYKITTTDQIVHRYINKIPLYGDTQTYFTLTSDESAELPVNLGYFLRVTVTNGSNQIWNLSAIMEIFRERTYMP